MQQLMLQGEVRLYFIGRVDFDTEFFKATSNTDILTKATKIAEKRRAIHFNCSLATELEEPRHTGRPDRRPKGLGPSAKDQVKAIESFLGVGESE